MKESGHEITSLLRRWREGDQQAYDQVMSLAYEEIKRVAGGVLGKKGSGATLITPTTLVHEAYLKLAGFQASRPWKDRREFYALLARAMMCFLIDHARKKASLKKGGDQLRVTLEEERLGAENGVDVLALDEVLQRLERLDARRTHIWRGRYLCGLNMAELAELFELSHATLHRELKAANGWLRGQLSLIAS